MNTDSPLRPSASSAVSSLRRASVGTGCRRLLLRVPERRLFGTRTSSCCLAPTRAAGSSRAVCVGFFSTEVG